MNYDYEKSLNEAYERVMDRVNTRLENMRNWLIHDWLFFNEDIPYEEAREIEYRAFGRLGGQ